MSHMIGTNDKQQGKSMAWHGLTEIKEDLTLATNWLRDWDVEEQNLYTEKGQAVIAARETDEDGNEKIFPWSVLRCSDDPTILIGRPYNPATFKPVKNADFLALIEKAMENIPYSVESVLSCCDRGRVAVSLKFEGLEAYKVGNREFEPMLSFGQGHDQSCVLYAVTSNICTVCNNTFNMNLAHDGKLVNVRIKHTRNISLAIGNVPEIIQAAIETQKQFAANFQALASQEIKHSEAKAIFTGYLVGEISDEELANPEFEISTRTANRVDRLLELFHDDTKGNEGKNLADVFSAVTDYYSHESAGGEDVVKQFLSSEIGSGNRVKQDFWAMVIDPEKLAAIKANGEKILAAS